MKNLLKLLLLIILINSSQCTSDLSNHLEGHWMSMDDLDCPDIIFFHKSGRYIVFNDCGSDNLLSISEKGHWEFSNKKLVLKNREFISRFSDFRNHHGNNLQLNFSIKFDSKNKEFDLDQGQGRYIETYRKIYTFPKIMEVYSGFEPQVKSIKLSSSGTKTLLKLSYKFFHYTTMKCPVELIIEDQAGHVLLHKELIFTDDVKKEELLLADKTEVFGLEELIFRINPKENGQWELKAKLY